MRIASVIVQYLHRKLSPDLSYQPSCGLQLANLIRTNEQRIYLLALQAQFLNRAILSCKLDRYRAKFERNGIEVSE